MNPSRLERLSASLRASGLDALALNPSPSLVYLTSLHDRRDVTLHEDGIRLTVGAAGHNIALNNLLIGLCICNGLANIAKAGRMLCAQPKYAL